VTAAAQHSAGQAVFLRAFLVRRKLLGFSPDRSDLFAVGKTRRDTHVGASLEGCAAAPKPTFLAVFWRVAGKGGR